MAGVNEEKDIPTVAEMILDFPFRPIRSDEELDRAIRIVDAMVVRDDLDADETAFLEAIGELIETYEDEHHPIAQSSDADLLNFLIEGRRVTQADVAAETGISQSTISEILAGKRRLNRRHIEILSGYFKISPATFFEMNPGGGG